MIHRQTLPYWESRALSKVFYKRHSLVRGCAQSELRRPLAFGRDPLLDFFESALAFMAGYGPKSFLIAQSLNQIEKAYGPNNAILDNCHVRVSFATNDERTARRVSDALGHGDRDPRRQRTMPVTGSSPWLGHLMVSRQETARPLLTPGEVMQLPAEDELVLISGCPPIRAKKARYFEDRRLAGTSVAPPKPARRGPRVPDRQTIGARYLSRRLPEPLEKQVRRVSSSIRRRSSQCGNSP